MVNVRYLTGFTGSAGLLLVLSDDVVFTQGAFDAFVGGTAAAQAEPVRVAEPAAEAAEADTAGSVEAGANASAEQSDAEEDEK